MGMAASQARFLGLTARKTNVEFEGQQINQQRVSLSNETANYNTQLLNMKVPVPPSVEEFTNKFYTWNGPAGEVYKITELRALANAIPGGNNFSINYSTTQNTTGQAYKPTGNNSLAQITRSFNTGSNTYDYFFGGNPLTMVTDPNTILLLQTAQGSQGTPASQFMTYMDTTTGQNVYISYDELVSASANFQPMLGSTLEVANMQKYLIGSHPITTNSPPTDVYIDTTPSGRLNQITINNQTYNLTLNTEKDDAAFSQAMSQYEFDKNQYSKTMQDVNSKLEIIQSQDKNLELKLKQLDTEQEAIQTEMEAVQKVIQKNTETTFKVFG